MAARSVDVLLVGGGVASGACAEQLREEGFDGSILLVGRESDPPYSRPPISKGYLTGAESREDALYQPESWYAEHDVELLLRTSVTKLDAEQRVATLSTRDEVGYDRALLATGANVRRLTVDGCELEGLHYLRALRNADALREDVREAERVVLVGGSYIGTEVAASLTSMGKRCAIVMQEEVTLQAGFGDQVGRHFQSLLEAHGIEVHAGEALARFEGSDGRVRRVVCDSGLELDADAVVLGVGVTPEVTLARSAGLELGERGGVRCDARLRSSAEGLWAAGDICEYDSVVHGRALRIEHWDVAVEQGRTVARNMLGAEADHETIPYFFSDLADWSAMEYVGPAASWDAEVVRGAMAEGPFTVFYLDGGRVVAALTVGASDDLDHARRLIAAGTVLGEAGAEALADPEADLATL